MQPQIALFSVQHKYKHITGECSIVKMYEYFLGVFSHDIPLPISIFLFLL